MMLAHHGALDKLKLFHLEDGGFNHQRDYKVTLKENAAEILENPKKYFVDYQEVRQKKFCSEDKKEGRKNSASEPKKFSSRAEKIQLTSDSLHI